MANREIEIDTAILSKDIGELETALTNARKQLYDMFEQIKELDAMWDGPANEAFKKQFANDYEITEELCDTIQSLITCMQYAREQYDLCENEVQGIVASISV